MPTTPTNTAHYAIVLPPTPTLSPKSGVPSPVNGVDTRSPRTRSEKSGAVGNGGVSNVAASRLPQYSSEAADSPNGDDPWIGASSKAKAKSRQRSLRSVVTRSSAGQELENLR